MTDHMRYDVAIVGASISGCAAAILFGRQGAKVALIERAQDPAAYKKICTHYIQPSATPTIERLGLATAIEMAGGSATKWSCLRGGAGSFLPRHHSLHGRLTVTIFDVRCLIRSFATRLSRPVAWTLCRAFQRGNC
jgi:2-polyprenyl-6-methoxyphenol hydroxylase-like FAD-dependent oxidoreductase